MSLVRTNQAVRFLFLAWMCLVPAIADDPPGRIGSVGPDVGSAANSAPDQTPNASAPAAPANDPDKLKVAIYPLFGWLPFLSSSANLPPPAGNVGGGSLIANPNTSLNGAAAFALDVTFKKWVFEGQGLFGSLSATRSSPYAKLTGSIDYGDFFVGHGIGKGFSVLGGFRRLAVGFDATVGDQPTFSRKPGVWDPLVGIEWRRTLGRKFYAQARFDGGGFGVGSDVDLDAQVRLEWRFVKHFGTVIGFQALHNGFSGTASVTAADTTVTRPWNYHQTLYGPLLGFGIYF
jgi:hypothetical protein